MNRMSKESGNEVLLADAILEYMEQAEVSLWRGTSNDFRKSMLRCMPYTIAKSRDVPKEYRDNAMRFGWLFKQAMMLLRLEGWGVKLLKQEGEAIRYEFKFQ